MIILAIDPGTATTGFGVVSFENGAFKTLDYGSINTKPGIPPELRLQKIYRAIGRLVADHCPDCLVVEQLFFNTNVQTAMAVGQARGMSLLVAADNSLPVVEYTPLQVKQAVVGYGRAEKAQVQEMVRMVLGLTERPKPDDAADALALAICHAHMYRAAEIIEQSDKC